MTPRQRRTTAIVLLVFGVGTATALILQAFRENLLYFYSPSEIVAGNAPRERDFRIGGMVVKGSVKRIPRTLDVVFVLSDYRHQTAVRYAGILPDLFREGQGIVANGRLQADGSFVAREVLAKHDENYMPPEVAASLKQAPPANGPANDQANAQRDP
ncbi:MAG: cytochrome c maturation protein CcmE [Gammaproteobacteria bacterium]